MDVVRRASALACIVFLASCGGGDGGSSGGGATSGPTPSPSPTASPPAPAPSPSPTYSRFADLTGDQTYKSSCSATMLRGYPPDSLPSSAFGNGLNIAYTASTQTYAISGDRVALSFGPNDTVAAQGGVKAYAKPGARTGTDMLRIGAASFNYMRFAALETTEPTFYQPLTYFCMIGVQTLATDLPATLTASYSTTVGGSLYYYDNAHNYKSIGQIEYILRPSTATIEVNWATRAVTLTLHLINQQTSGGPQVDLGVYTGTGSIDPNTGLFRGTWSRPGLNVSSSFNGAFLGPQGKEIAVTYDLSSRPPGNLSSTVVSSGWIYGFR